jgi:hypothetical protein
MGKGQMRRLSCGFGAGIAVVAVSALGAGLSSAASTASKSSVVAGKFAIATDFFSALSSTKNAEISQLKYTGALTGVAIDNGRETNHSNGSFVGAGTEYCAACTIAGKSGAFIASYRYSGSGNAFSGTLTFTSGFGKLAGLKGGGTFKGNIATNSGAYRYHYTLP